MAQEDRAWERKQEERRLLPTPGMAIEVLALVS
jgi:hypothetical protein